MSDHGEDIRVGHELLRDRCRARAVGLVIARDDLEGTPIYSACAIDLVNREIDSAMAHDSVSLFPGTGRAYRI